MRVVNEFWLLWLPLFIETFLAVVTVVVVIGFWLLWLPLDGVGYAGELDKPVDKPVTENQIFRIC